MFLVNDNWMQFDISCSKSKNKISNSWIGTKICFYKKTSAYQYLIHSKSDSVHVGFGLAMFVRRINKDCVFWKQLDIVNKKNQGEISDLCNIKVFFLISGLGYSSLSRPNSNPQNSPKYKFEFNYSYFNFSKWH